MATLAEVLAENTVPGDLFQKLEDHRVRCFACGHRCTIKEDSAGICKVRFNQKGVLRIQRKSTQGKLLMEIIASGKQIKLRLKT